MLAKTYTVSFQGVEAREVTVEVFVAAGLPSFQIVGLPDRAVGESRERIRASFHHLSLQLPPKKIIANLAPADLQKEGSHYDLPIALALLAALGILKKEEVEEYISLGELGLDGRISRVQGVLAAALTASAKGKGLICPQAGGSEAVWAGEDVPLLAPPDLLSLIQHFRGERFLTPPEARINPTQGLDLDMTDVKGQILAKKALEIAAAGSHHVLFMGSPGVGKSMLAQRLPGLLPSLTPEQALEVTIIYSLAGLLPEDGLISQRPFRDPHHSASLPALIGGGMRSKPGEISLAHQGVLFLDEMPEFSRPVLESLRQPLETGRVTIARANHHVTYPAQIQLIGAMNPCRCGFYFDLSRQCSRVPQCFQDYQNKLSGPLLDRFDLIVTVDDIKPKELISLPMGEASSEIKKRVNAAREVQHKRGFLNSHLEGKYLEKELTLSSDARSFLAQALDQHKLSARGYHRVLRVSRTIQDLFGDFSPMLSLSSVSQAMAYRIGMSF